MKARGMRRRKERDGEEKKRERGRREKRERMNTSATLMSGGLPSKTYIGLIPFAINPIVL